MPRGYEGPRVTARDHPPPPPRARPGSPGGANRRHPRSPASGRRSPLSLASVLVISVEGAQVLSERGPNSASAAVAASRPQRSRSCKLVLNKGKEDRPRWPSPRRRHGEGAGTAKSSRSISRFHGRAAGGGLPRGTAPRSGPRAGRACPCSQVLEPRPVAAKAAPPRPARPTRASSRRLSSRREEQGSLRRSRLVSRSLRCRSRNFAAPSESVSVRRNRTTRRVGTHSRRAGLSSAS